ncbi:MAG: hypothetical protein R8J85_05580, partial [Mariprofundales bacterium]
NNLVNSDDAFKALVAATSAIIAMVKYDSFARSRHRGHERPRKPMACAASHWFVRKVKIAFSLSVKQKVHGWTFCDGIKYIYATLSPFRI